MCTPIAAMVAVQVASSAAQAAQQQQQADSANTTAYANAQNAAIAAQRKYSDTQQRYVYDAKATGQEGYKAAIQGREAESTAKASAADAGLELGFSVDDVLAGVKQKTANNLANVQDKFDDLRTSTKNSMDSTYAEAKGRIASMPMQTGASPLALGLNIASAVGKGYTANNNAGWANFTGS